MTKSVITLASGNEIAYWTHNDDKKPILILVHGFTGSHEGFQYLVPLLDDFRLIIPDLPGFGVSPLPHESLTLAHLGGLLAEFVDALDLGLAPFLLGHSMGSLVVAEAVRQRPDIASKKLILISPVPSAVGFSDSRRGGVMVSQLYYALCHRIPFIGSKLATSKKIAHLSTEMIMTAKDKGLKQAIHQHHFDNLNFISSIGWYRRLYRQINNTGINRYRIAFKPFHLLIINGTKDSVTPLSQQKKSAELLGARLVTIPNVGHLSHYETPTELVQEIKRFLLN